MLISVVVSTVFGIGSIDDALVGFMFTQAASAIVAVFSTAALAIAYTELSALRDEEGRLAIEEEPVPPKEGVETI